jgi:hypothetical protein
LANRPTRKTGDEVLFYEEQRFVQPWIWIPILLCVIFAWYAFYRQIVQGVPVGSRPSPDWGLWLVFLIAGIGIPALFVSLKLRVQVRPDRLEIRFFPFVSRTIALHEITDCRARKYRPIREYGGWGIRCGGRRGTAYNVSGNTGVQLDLAGHKKLLLGSQRAEELADAIRRAKHG